MKEKIYTIGIDVGSSLIKASLIEYSANPVILDKRTEKIRKRNPEVVADQVMDSILETHNLTFEDIAYVATTGEGELLKRKKGHFYSMTTHARGGIFMNEGAKTVVDMGALYVRAIKINELGRVLNYKMTGQCASGSGQFVENISKYLGVAIEDVGETSLKATNPEKPSGICSVLAETDVINMVSRGITTPDIIKGIHLSIADKIIKLLTSLKAESPIALTGGMAINHGMVQAIEELAHKANLNYQFVTHQDAIFAGSYGAAIWGGYRYLKLKSDNAIVL
ncbi:MAG: benzoyl-CoA reductase subunit D [Ignavibacteria bacterium GWF2_33_9]|nr:MAG: benzoyl-CoA reductase subunit D [Ignavibacteria bacterium GWF2_33_9]